MYARPGYPTLSVTVDRGGAPVTLNAVPELKELKDNFGNVHRLGVLGISRSMSPGDIKTEKMGPLQAVVAGAQETWFVVDRTMSYIGGVVVGREAAEDRGVRAVRCGLDGPRLRR